MKIRFRHIYLFGGSLLIVAALLWTDPDHGVDTGLLALSLLTPILAVLIAHFARKALFDYPEADARLLFNRARESPTGAGLALVALAIVTYAVIGLFGRQVQAADIKTYVPVNAHQYLPVLKHEQITYWQDHPKPPLLAALVEQESCISLTHSKCWNPRSRLKTQREEGAGMGQITRAYRPDGSLRFDALAEMRSHPALREMSWASIYTRPDLQLRALVVKVHDDYKRLSVVHDQMARLAFADAAYNGGMNGVLNERRACGMKSGCDPQIWFRNVELVCLKSKRPLYGNRNACDINREHVTNVVLVRSPKYMAYM